MVHDPFPRLDCHKLVTLAHFLLAEQGIIILHTCIHTLLDVLLPLAILQTLRVTLGLQVRVNVRRDAFARAVVSA